MDFDLLEEHLAFRDVVRRWVDAELPKEWARKLEADEHNYPHALWEKFTEAGFHGIGIPEEFGGQGGDVLLQMLLARELARSLGGLAWIWGITSFAGSKSIGLYGTPEQKAKFLPEIAAGRLKAAISFTEPGGGTDLLGNLATTAERVEGGWVLNGEKTWNTGIHTATHDLIFARTSGKAGDGDGITAFLVPTNSPGFKVEEMLWTFNMPTDHGHVTFKDVSVPGSAVFGQVGRGLQVVQHFFNENRIRQAASSLGAAQFCVNEAVAYAKVRKPFGKPLASNQGIQFPLVELQTQCEMLRALIHKTAWLMDRDGAFSVSDKVSMCNYWGNRLCCEAADRAMQVHGGMGY
jgi:alkylation response protein AidB-like acyl-CoA dehydrogenase